jgi:hypothetical protein
MLIPSSSQSVPQRHSTKTPLDMDRRVHDTYESLLNLPVPERFVELVQSYPDQRVSFQGTETANRCPAIT